jgi:DNA topoisomerase-2
MSSKTTKKKTYIGMKHREWALKRPDSYLGSTDPIDYATYVANPSEVSEDVKSITKFSISKQNMTYVQAVGRLFVEVISNAIDNAIDNPSLECKKIKITRNDDCITVWNDGDFIPIEHVSEENPMYKHTFIFGTLLTSSNYDDTVDRSGSGRNGLGVKIVSIFSKKFVVEGVDPENGLKFVQTWTDNMGTVGEPKVTKSKRKVGYTSVSWIPDFERFGMEGYDADIITLFTRYAIDCALNTRVTVNIWGTNVKITSLTAYARYYTGDTTEIISFHTDDCDVVVTSNNSDEFKHISFVNGINTSDGGVHVDAWTEALFRPVVDRLNKGRDGKLTITHVKKCFMIFVKATLDKPKFTTQTKVFLSSPTPVPKVKKTFVSTVMKWSIRDRMDSFFTDKDDKKLRDIAKKRDRVEGIEKAGKAGTKFSAECSLIITEGLSANTYAAKGIEKGVFDKTGKDWFTLMPVRGKTLNVRQASVAKIEKSKIVCRLIRALRLEKDVDYLLEKNFKKLTHGKILLLVDPDHDGTHIAGLILNTIHFFAPTILQRDDPFIYLMRTPIARDLTNMISFYSYDSYYTYNKLHPKYKYKFYKGLGTSSDREIMETFGEMMTALTWDNDSTTSIDKCFGSDADLRKVWIGDYENHPCETITMNTLPITNFLDEELVLYSIDDCHRNMPNIMDGLKPSQRMGLYAVFLKNLTYTSNALKVVQLAGFAAEKTGYDHGEHNIPPTLIKMAQSYTDSNNIPPLYRGGQFGSRKHLGEDAAAGRYIFTKMDFLTRMIYRKDDEPILKRLYDGDKPTEPEFYVPIVPQLLVNGAKGIGTGWASHVPSYNITDLVEAVNLWIEWAKEGDVIPEDEKFELIPWYRGFMGTIEFEETKNRYCCTGVVTVEEVKGKYLHSVTEIPIGLSIDSYRIFLESLEDNKKISKLRDNSSVNIPRFEFVSTSILSTKELRLIKYLGMNCLNVFDDNLNLKSYKTVWNIITKFCEVRYEYYQKRKVYQLKTLKHELMINQNKRRYIGEHLSGDMSLFNKSGKKLISKGKAVMEKELLDAKYDKIEDTYNYLLRLQVMSFSTEKIEELDDEIRKILKKIKEIEDTTEFEMWTSELEELLVDYEKYLKILEKEDAISAKLKTLKKKGRKGKK